MPAILTIRSLYKMLVLTMEKIAHVDNKAAGDSLSFAISVQHALVERIYAESEVGLQSDSVKTAIYTSDRTREGSPLALPYPFSTTVLDIYARSAMRLPEHCAHELTRSLAFQLSPDLIWLDYKRRHGYLVAGC